ncbi:MAG: DUF5329 domain-containing protein [Comamonas sp.]|uniref:DUF5329 domain-containing protein n=1 Tax=Comamonas sp. lk TaxID=2201272 RepID=UPI001F097CA9|nr:DUF5329 domain-containing protein [Comamonas sp. lk]
MPQLNIAKMVSGFALFLAAGPAQLALAAAPSAQAQQEIAHLQDYLKNSGCEFQRNGSWHSSVQARDHLQKKYDYLVKKDLLQSAEDFIARAATESSISHKAYEVRCAGKAVEPASSWLQAELKRYRAQLR